MSSCLGSSCFRVQQGITQSGRSGSDGLFGDLIPYLESGADFGAVIGGGHPVSGRAEVRRDPAERGKKSLCCTDSAEPFHRPLTLAGGLVGVLAPIVQILALSMLHRRHHRAVCDPIRSELVGDQYPRRAGLPLQEFLEESGRGPCRPAYFGSGCRARFRTDRPPATNTSAPHRS